MDSGESQSGLELRSRLTTAGEIELSLVEVTHPPPGADEVLIRIEASPINPSDLGLLIASADVSTAELQGSDEAPLLTMKVPSAALPSLKGRLNQSLPVGNEGAGTVIQAGSSQQAQALLGRTVALVGGAMFAQYRVAKASDCLVLPEGTDPTAAASSFVNPLTALGMVETMRREGHTALVHTAAASNLGQMLNRVCLKDGVRLVNIVRSDEQATLLRSLGAELVCNSRSPGFEDEPSARSF